MVRDAAVPSFTGFLCRCTWQRRYPLISCKGPGAWGLGADIPIVGSRCVWGPSRRQAAPGRLCVDTRGRRSRGARRGPSRQASPRNTPGAEIPRCALMLQAGAAPNGVHGRARCVSATFFRSGGCRCGRRRRGAGWTCLGGQISDLCGERWPVEATRAHLFLAATAAAWGRQVQAADPPMCVPVAQTSEDGKVSREFAQARDRSVADARGL